MALPQSTTNTMSSIVMEVSAMLVDSTIFLTPGGGLAKIFCWFAVGMEPWSGMIRYWFLFDNILLRWS